MINNHLIIPPQSVIIEKTALELVIMQSGIYMILNLINGKYYIGSAVNFNKRWITHEWKLNQNCHTNIHLQYAWNKYGADNFQFTIIEYIENKKDLIEIEQKWIDISDCCDRNFGYNINPIAGSQLGLKRSEQAIINIRNGQIGKKASIETKLKLSLKRKGNSYNRKYDIWPCLTGFRCNCNNCKKKKRENQKLYMRKRRNSNLSYENLDG